MISVSLSYGLGVGQVALLGAIILCYPAVRVQTYTYTACVVNGSLTRECGRVTSAWLDVAAAWGLLSVAVAWYVIATFRKMDNGELRGDFTSEEDGELWGWDLHFWGVVACVHWCVVFMACSPTHLYTGAAAGALMAYALTRICRAGSSSSGNMGGLLVYIAGVGVACHSIPANYPNRYFLVGGQMLLDYGLGMGHGWDRVTTMETVGNCRVCYATWSALLLTVAYRVWGDSLALASEAGDDASI